MKVDCIGITAAYGVEPGVIGVVSGSFVPGVVDYFGAAVQVD